MPDEPRAHDAFVRTCRANASKLEAELQSLGSDYWTDDDRIVRRNDFYAHAGRVFQLFKDLTLVRADRDRLWTRYQEIRQKAKQRTERWAAQSRQKRDLILGKLDEAGWMVDGAETEAHLQRAADLIQQALSWMNPGWSQVDLSTAFVNEGIVGDPGILASENRRACFERYRQIKNQMYWKRRELSSVNKSVLAGRIDDALHTAGAHPRKAASALKQVQTDMKAVTLVREDRQDLWALVQRAWDTVKAGHRCSDVAYVDRLEHARETSEVFRERLVVEIARMEVQIAHAWTDAWQQKAEERLAQKRHKLRDVEGRVAEIAGKLADVRSRL